MADGPGAGEGPPKPKIRERRTSFSDIPIGGRRESLDEPIAAFTQKGVPVSRELIGQLRRGHTSGIRIEDRVKAAELRREDSASRKDNLYFTVTQKGVSIRRPQQSPHNAHKFDSGAFTEELAQAAQIKPQALRKLIRAMRVDMVSAQMQNPDQRFLHEFIRVAESYLEDYLDNSSPSLRPAALERLRERWGGDSVEDFYKILYEEVVGKRALGTWTPYEIEALMIFYKGRIALGSPLTDFDKQILEARQSGTSMANFVDNLRRTTNIPVEPSILEEHGNALLYGKPT